MRRGRIWGFSLIELVIILFLTGICLFMVGRLTSQTFQTLRFLRGKSQTLQAAAQGIERLTSELREAVEVSSTDPLTFSKVDPSAPFALDYDGDSSTNANPGDPDPDLPPDTWSDSYARDAFDRNQLGSVTYQMADGVLSRTATVGTRDMTSEVATEVNDFSVTRGPELAGVATADSVFEISLSLQEDRRVVVFGSVVVVPGLAR